MKLQTVKNELWEIAKAYPTLAGILQKKMSNNLTVGHHWAELLKDLEQTHFEDVCYEYATLQQPLPEPQDQLVFAIRHEVRDRKAKEEAKLEQHQKYHTNNKVMQWVRSDATGSIAVRLGEMVREGTLTREENDQRMDDLLAWEKQHDKTDRPEWLEKMGAC